MSLLAWVMVPMAYFLGQTAGADDVIHFLSHSSVHPILLMVLSLAVFLTCLGLAWKKGVFGVWMEILKKEQEGE